MNLTKPKMNDSEVSSRLAGELFDGVVVPRASAKRATRPDPYFPLQRDPKASSYFAVPDVKSMAPSDFEFPGGGDPYGLIDSLAEFWAARGEADLSESMASRLKPIAEALDTETAQDDGSVDILCYTLF